VEQDLNRFEEMLNAATSRIEHDYFLLPVTDADAVYRERVYCYELYPQLRCLWGGFRFSLGGEIDKVGNPHFRGGPYARAKPDFLVHVPGNMDRNLACVEVKPFAQHAAQFAHDLKKLTWFCHHAYYHCGIFLAYGTDPNRPDTDAELQENLQEALTPDETIDPSVIHVFHHAQISQPAQRIEFRFLD
jgi:hypothetical protein